MYDRKWTPTKFSDFECGVQFAWVFSAVAVITLVPHLLLQSSLETIGLPFEKILYLHVGFFCVPHALIHIAVGISYIINKIKWPQIEFKCASRKRLYN